MFSQLGERFQLHGELMAWTAAQVEALPIVGATMVARRKLLEDPAFVVATDYPAGVIFLAAEFGHDERFRYFVLREFHAEAFAASSSPAQ